MTASTPGIWARSWSSLRRVWAAVWPVSESGGGGVEQGVEGVARKPPGDGKDDSGDEQGGDGVGELERGQAQALAKRAVAARPSRTAKEDQISVPKWAASAASASERYASAVRRSERGNG